MACKTFNIIEHLHLYARFWYNKKFKTVSVFSAYGIGGKPHMQTTKIPYKRTVIKKGSRKSSYNKELGSWRIQRLAKKKKCGRNGKRTVLAMKTYRRASAIWCSRTRKVDLHDRSIERGRVGWSLDSWQGWLRWFKFFKFLSSIYKQKKSIPKCQISDVNITAFPFHLCPLRTPDGNISW